MLTLACMSNLAEWSWLARCAAPASACCGVSALANGEAQAATATIVKRLRKSRFIELPEYIDAGTPIPSSPKTSVSRGRDGRHVHGLQPRRQLAESGNDVGRREAAGEDRSRMFQPDRGDARGERPGDGRVEPVTNHAGRLQR